LTVGAQQGRGNLSHGQLKVPLGGRSVVVLQQPAKPFATIDLDVSLPDFLPRFDELVIQPLVISLAMIVETEFANSGTQRLLAEEDDPVETLGF
jgi:hypothetical protein